MESGWHTLAPGSSRGLVGMEEVTQKWEDSAWDSHLQKRVAHGVAHPLLSSVVVSLAGWRLGASRGPPCSCLAAAVSGPRRGRLNAAGLVFGPVGP